MRVGPDPAAAVVWSSPSLLQGGELQIVEYALSLEVAGKYDIRHLPEEIFGRVVPGHVPLRRGASVIECHCTRCAIDSTNASTFGR